MRGKILLMISVSAILLVSACGVHSFDKNLTPKAEETPSTLKIYAIGPNGIPLGGDPKKLAGGPEITERMPRPMDNADLQTKFPNVLFLHGSSQDRKIALTFDDGPDSRFTPQVLNVLKKHNVKATFFVMGSRAIAEPHLTERINKEGHVIGNHTYWHPKLFKENMDRLHWEVSETDKVIRNITGYTPRLFRAPYGALNTNMVSELDKMHDSVIGWNVDSLDWKQLDSETVYDNVVNTVKPGAIILMHCGGDWTQDLSGTVRGLDKIIPKLHAQGYQFVTVPELLNIPVGK